MSLSIEGSGLFHLCKIVSTGGFFLLTCHAPSENGWDFSALYRVSDNSGTPILNRVSIFCTSYNVKDISITAQFETDGLIHVYADKPTYWSFFAITPFSSHIYVDIYKAD